jgi:hypothetical protein
MMVRRSVGCAACLCFLLSAIAGCQGWGEKRVPPEPAMSPTGAPSGHSLSTPSLGSAAPDPFGSVESLPRRGQMPSASTGAPVGQPLDGPSPY